MQSLKAGHFLETFYFQFLSYKEAHFKKKHFLEKKKLKNPENEEPVKFHREFVQNRSNDYFQVFVRAYCRVDFTIRRTPLGFSI